MALVGAGKTLLDMVAEPIKMVMRGFVEASDAIAASDGILLLLAATAMIRAIKEIVETTLDDNDNIASLISKAGLGATWLAVLLSLLKLWSTVSLWMWSVFVSIVSLFVALGTKASKTAAPPIVDGSGSDAAVSTLITAPLLLIGGMVNGVWEIVMKNIASVSNPDSSWWETIKGAVGAVIDFASSPFSSMMMMLMVIPVVIGMLYLAWGIIVPMLRGLVMLAVAVLVLPITLAVYPVAKDWTKTAVGVAAGGVMQAGVAVFLGMLAVGAANGMITFFNDYGKDKPTAVLLLLMLACMLFVLGYLMGDVVKLVGGIFSGRLALGGGGGGGGGGGAAAGGMGSAMVGGAATAGVAGAKAAAVGTAGTAGALAGSVIGAAKAWGGGGKAALKGAVTGGMSGAGKLGGGALRMVNASDAQASKAMGETAGLAAGLAVGAASVPIGAALGAANAAAAGGGVTQGAKEGAATGATQAAGVAGAANAATQAGMQSIGDKLNKAFGQKPEGGSKGGGQRGQGGFGAGVNDPSDRPQAPKGPKARK